MPSRPDFDRQHPLPALILAGACSATAPVLAAEGCHVTLAGETPPGCSATSVWNAPYDPATIDVGGGAFYLRSGALQITNSNAAGNPTGTRGLWVQGQGVSAAVTTASEAAVTGNASIDISVTNAADLTANEGVRASMGGRISVAGDLSVTTRAAASYEAPALVATGTGSGALLNSGSDINVVGRLTADTTAAPDTPYAVAALDGGRIVVRGGRVQSAQLSVYVLQPSTSTLDSQFVSDGSNPLTLTSTAGSVVMLRGSDSANLNNAKVTLNQATLTSDNHVALMLMNAGSVRSRVQYSQTSGSITATQGSAVGYLGAAGSATVTLRNTDIATGAMEPGGADADGVAAGYAVYSNSSSDLNTLNMVGGTISGPIETETGAKLSLVLDGTLWDSKGSPDSATVNTLSGLWGNGTVRMPDIRDTITLRGDAAGMGDGCGTASLVLQVPPQAPPTTSPFVVMTCRNAATYPSMALAGGSVVLGGFSYTLQRVVADGRAYYQLVKGNPAPTEGGANNVTSVPTLGSWGLLALAGLLGLGGMARRRFS